MSRRNRIRKRIRGFSIILMIFLTFSGTRASYGNLVRVQNLEGQWKFSIGEREEWVEKGYDDSDWATIKVPAAWEDEGFNGYNGFASYRKSFTLPASLKGKNLYLILGYVDDVDETYINGHRIGSTGTFPPSYNTAYNAKRIYYIPQEVLNFNGSNLLAVKVYDSYQYGGIVRGEVGIYANPDEVPVEINLQGKWKFKIGDELERSKASYNDKSWGEVFAPAKWEDQGYRDYDGYAWYRKTFYYKGNLDDSKLVLMLGRIDDLDEVFLNGVEIGSTGTFSDRENQRLSTGDEYRAVRGYYFDASLLRKNQYNTIAIRIYDSGGDGGIYEGPVGILTQTDYIKYWRERKSSKR
jgi:beta-galactosidase/beta-glucuronidase